MSGTVLIHLIIYAAVATFGGVVAYRFFKMWRMPMHLRWELYPVAHEYAKARYGGSILEEIDWWTKERDKSLMGELRVMIPEMTLLVALFEHNRKLWYRSFPFHFGLYCLAGLIGLIVLGALMELIGMDVSAQAGFLGAAVYYATIALAFVGLTLAFAGAFGLYILRKTDHGLREFASFGTMFNLVAFMAVLGVAWLAFAFADGDFELTRGFVGGLITFDLNRPVGSFLVGLEVVLATLLMAYIPMTHMSHFFLKWFTYHKIRWDDEPNEVGSDVEKKIIEQVQYPVSWAADHIKGDGRKNWVDIATEEME